MAIKNTALGGTDWVDNDYMSATDVNDTFDAAVDKIKSLSAFWLNSFLFDTYDNFDSYSVGAWVNNSLWTYANSGDASNSTRSITVASTTFAGGSGKEIVFSVNINGGTGGAWSCADFYTPTVTANRHWFARINQALVTAGSSTNGQKVEFSINGTNFDILASVDSNGGSGTNSGYCSLFVQAKGSDAYDIWFGGKLIRSVTTASPVIFFRVGAYANAASSQTATVRLDDVYYSKADVV